MSRFDVAGLPRIVGKRSAKLLNAGDESVIRDHDLAPHGGKQVLLRDWMAGALDQHTEHCRGLAREPDLEGVFPETPGGALETKGTKGNVLSHPGSRPCCRRERSRRNPGIPTGL